MVRLPARAKTLLQILREKILLRFGQGTKKHLRNTRVCRPGARVFSADLQRSSVDFFQYFRGDGLAGFDPVGEAGQVRALPLGGD
jgi:hypothetical protein